MTKGCLEILCVCYGCTIRNICPRIDFVDDDPCKCCYGVNTPEVCLYGNAPHVNKGRVKVSG